MTALHGSGKDPEPPATVKGALATACPDEPGQADPLCNHCQTRGRNHEGTECSELTLRRIWKVLDQHVSDHELQDCVAKELEPFVGHVHVRLV